jgi:hypothetical protein
MTQVRRVWGLVAIAAVLLAGCRVDARVDVRLANDGSGTIRTTLKFDGDAIQRLGGLNRAARQVPLADLRKAGWKISGLVKGPRASATLVLTHAFRDQQDLARRLADLVGPQGLLRDPRITRDRGWFSSRNTLSLVVDLREPVSGIGSDADLKARLRIAGLDPASLDKQLTAELRSALHLTVVVRLPDGTTRTYDATNGTVATVAASQSNTDYDRIVKLGIAAALALLAGLFLLAASASARRQRRRRAARVRAEVLLDRDRAPLM